MTPNSSPTKTTPSCSSSNLKENLAPSGNESTFNQEKEICPENFNQAVNTSQQKESLSQDVRIFQCKICDKIYTAETTLVMHYEKTHNLFRCGRCEKEYSVRDELTRHVKVTHPLEEFGCSICGTSLKVCKFQI